MDLRRKTSMRTHVKEVMAVANTVLTLVRFDTTRKRNPDPSMDTSTSVALEMTVLAGSLRRIDF
jgi:hypothetical protein